MRKLLLPIILIIALCLPALAKTAVITKIEAKKDRGYDYLDIYSSCDVKAKPLLLENKLVLDFPGAKISAKIKIKKHKSSRVKNIRAYQFDQSTARIVLDLKKGIDYDVVHVFGRGKTVVEVSDRVDRAERIMAAWENMNLKTKAGPLKSKKYHPQVTRDRSLAGKVIVVDPGHGGKDPGATSRSGALEKTLTLQTAKKTMQKLTAAGATVYLTRSGDSTSHLKNIVGFTNKIRPDIFISIHYNYSDNGNIGGTETYYYTGQSRRLALLIHQAMVAGLKRRDRGLRKAMFYAIHHTAVPAVLVEPLYLSNYNEEKLARAGYFQEKLASQITAGVKNYFRNK